MRHCIVCLSCLLVCTSLLRIKTLACLYFMSRVSLLLLCKFVLHVCATLSIKTLVCLHSVAQKSIKSLVCLRLLWFTFACLLCTQLSLVAIQTTSSTAKDFWKLHTEITFEVCGGTLTSCSSIKMIDSA